MSWNNKNMTAIVLTTKINILNISNETIINQNIKKYINRLSDLLFVIARSANLVNNKEILWKPGKNLKI